jgi:serine/threonine protein kinase/tetratricopeptide (TPR) repeat protein
MQFVQDGATPPSLTRTVETPARGWIRGQIVAGRYEIIETLGRGGMGSVYRVDDKKVGEEVALKIIRPEIAADEQTIERFRNELKLTRKIAHRNVCKMYDMGEEEGTHFITMEYVPGETLKSLVDRIGQLPVEKSVAIAQQICQGLTEAHNLGVIHRDLKPQNVMIDKAGNAHIMDFGIARSVSTPGVTVSGAVIGTPGYMAPEQLEGQQADQRSDIYSLGIILFEMLTGRLPFEGDTAIAIAMKQKNENPPNPREFNSQIPEDLGLLIQKCLVADPESRIQGVEHVLEMLQNIETTKLDDSHEASPLVDKRRPKKNFPYFKFAVGILLLAAVIIAGFLIVPKIFPPEREVAVTTSAASHWENSIAVLPFRDQSPRKDQEHICTGLSLAINNRLTQLGNLKVISLSTVMHYKDRQIGIKQIGQELGVENILDGTILRDGNRIRIMGELIEAKSGANLWSDVFEGDLEKVFDVYDQVSQKVAEAMQLELAPDAVMALKSDKPENMEAYEYYLKAMTYLNTHYVLSRDEKDFDTAIQMFDRAVEFDSNYALAYAGLAWAYQHHYISTDNLQDFLKVKENMEVAYKLDPEHPLVLACKSWVELGGGNGKEAFDSLRKAMAINPNIAELNFSIGVICRFSGLSQLAIKYLARAHELDPYYLYSLVGYAANHFFIGELEEALPLFEKVYAMGPDDPIVAQFYSAFCIMKGDFTKAQNIISRWERIYPGDEGISDLSAYLHAAKGEREKALQLEPQTYWYSYVYAELGMAEEAVEYIKKFLDRQVYLPYLKLTRQPVFKKLQDDPRFQEIVEIQKRAYELRLMWAEGF